MFYTKYVMMLSKQLLQDFGALEGRQNWSRTCSRALHRVSAGWQLDLLSTALVCMCFHICALVSFLEVAHRSFTDTK